MSELSRPLRSRDDVLRPAGDRAFLCIPAPDRVAELATELRERSLPGVVDLLPAAQTVLVTVDSPASADRLRPEIERLIAAVNATVPGNVSRGTLPRGEPLRIPVHYDGPDLPEVADALGIRPDEVIAAHTDTVWRCAFAGFAPGFGYLEAPDDRLTVARRSTPRTRIPAGSVALAGGYSAVYPRESPGGWQLIGRTGLTMWDTERDPPALIRAGELVRFVDAAARR